MTWEISGRRADGKRDELVIDVHGTVKVHVHVHAATE